MRLAPLESRVFREMSVFPGSAARLATGALQGPLAHKVLQGPLASEASRARRAAWVSLACQAPRVFEETQVIGAWEVLQAPRENREWQVPMVFLETKASWDLAAQ